MIQEPHCSYFLFINSGSGGGIGQKLIEQEICLDERNLQSNKKNIDVYFFNLRKNKDKAFNVLKLLVEKKFNLKVVICGGDGTIMWVISELNKFNIDTQHTPLAIIPLGTGNDFSQYLGWGKLKTSLTQSSFASLKKLIRKWQKAKIQYFDVWDIKAQVFEHGKFEKVQNQQNKVIEGKTFCSSFCNYFSFGMDGKIGYSFDMHRTKSRLGNLAMYGILGMVKAMTKTKSINKLIHGMQIKPELNYDFIQKQQMLEQPLESMAMNKQYSNFQTSDIKVKSCQSSPDKQQNKKTSFIFKTKNSIMPGDVSQLKKDYKNIVALNINSFMGGVFDIWKNAKVRVENIQADKFTDMNSGDSRLQFISFSSSLGMAAERTFGGFAQKITQGEGPFYFQFKEYPANQKHRTYLQIDGEFIRFTHPKSVLIRKSLYGRNGKVRVLRNIES